MVLLDLTTMTVQDSNTDQEYLSIHRNFVFPSSDRETTFTGFENMLPKDAQVIKDNNIHGSDKMVLALTN